MSHKWQDSVGGHYLNDYTNLPPFMDEFPGILHEINLIFDVSGGAFGCGFRRMEELHNWFSATELERLKLLGYRIVKITADKIIRSSHRQTVFWCRDKLANIAKAKGGSK